MKNMNKKLMVFLGLFVPLVMVYASDNSLNKYQFDQSLGILDSGGQVLINIDLLRQLKNSQRMFQDMDNVSKHVRGLVKNTGNVVVYSIIARVLFKDQKAWSLTAFPAAWTCKELLCVSRTLKTLYKRPFVMNQILWRYHTQLESDQITALEQCCGLMQHLNLDPKFLQSIKNYHCENK